MPSERTGKRIEKVAFLPHGKVKVSFGKEELLLSKDIFTDRFLYVGKTLLPIEIEAIKKEMAMDGLYRYGKGLASKGSYSSFEILSKLRKKDPLQSEAVYCKLEREGFFDDKELAKDYYEAMRAKGYGERRVKDDLFLKKRIAPDIVASLSKDTDGALAPLDLLSSYEKRFKGMALEEKKRKVEGSLLRKGYSRSEILPALAALKPPSKEDELMAARKDLARFERSYRKKYNGLELCKRLRAALYRKGHSKETIDKIMEEKDDGLD